MALKKQFDQRLKRLMQRRTAVINLLIGHKRRGPIPRFRKDKVEPEIDRLSEIAKNILTKQLARKEFSAAVEKKHTWRVKGHGRPAKQKLFKQWYDKTIGKLNCVYIFWDRSTCIYVGRTGKGKHRPAGSFTQHWFNLVTRVDVYEVWKPRMLPMLECLACDIFNPSRNRIVVARKKYVTKCPICSSVKLIKSELQQIFRLR
jgi:hypothetical protein